MKVIETRYKGYRFRSRLEARWAVFFDSLDVAWEYEPEGYDLGKHGLYLPDFYLPTVNNGLFVEIKPVEPTDQEKAKLRALVNTTGKIGTFRVGEPMINVFISDFSAFDKQQKHSDGSWHEDNALVYFPDEDGDERSDFPYLFCLCPICGKFGMEYLGRGERICSDTHPNNSDYKCYTGNHTKIVNAAKRARSSRFEHGECGAPA